MIIKLVNKDLYNLVLLCNPQINSMVMAWPNEDPAGNVWFIATHREECHPTSGPKPH